jgi:hypothetical protein
MLRLHYMHACMHEIEVTLRSWALGWVNLMRWLQGGVRAVDGYVGVGVRRTAEHARVNVIRTWSVCGRSQHCAWSDIVL